MPVVLAILAALVLLRSAMPRGTPRIRPPGSEPSRSIAVLEKVRLGGAGQWVLQRSENIENPVILFLHGGPGTAQLTSNRRNTRDLERHFTVVNWDQRGAGKSYAAIRDAEKMTIEQFVEDTHELTLYLCRKFKKTRIVLAGHSFGSVVGVMAAAKYPELFSCYVGIGQVANMTRGELTSYEWTLQEAEKRNNRKAVAALRKMGPPPYSGNWQKKTISQRMYLARFGGEVYGNSLGAMGFVLRGLAFSREYGLLDRVNFFRGIRGSMKLLWPALMKVNLEESVPRLDVPVFFMEGRFDREAPSELAAAYFESLDAPAKQLIWFENSAHLPNSEEREAFSAALIREVLPIARRADEADQPS